MKNLFFLCFFGLFDALFAQKPMVAYRKEGIWHFFNTNGKSMWEPFADKAGNPSGWVNGLLRGDEMIIDVSDPANFSVSRRQVLYNFKGEIVFAPKLPFPHRILGGFDKSGLIQLRNLDTEVLYLCDEKGKIQFQSNNSAAQYLGDNVVAELKNEADFEVEGDKTFKLSDVKTKKILGEIKCRGFLGDFKSGAMLCFDVDFKFGIINRAGKLVQPMIWTSEKLIDLDADFLKSDFVFLKKETDETGFLFNKKGEVILSNVLEEIWIKNNFIQCKIIHETGEQTNTYSLSNDKIKQVDDLFSPSSEPTEGGIIACQDIDYLTFLLDQNLKTIAKIEKSSKIKVLSRHFWIRPSFKKDFVCFNEKGEKTGEILADEIGEPAFGHVFFRQNERWGLAQENGKIVIKPTLIFSKNVEEKFNIPEIMDGFFSISTKTTDDFYRFDYYDFSGKLIFGTDPEKDGWDYLMEQQNYPSLYANF
jgi:hypothetical protein